MEVIFGAVEEMLYVLAEDRGDGAFLERQERAERRCSLGDRDLDERSFDPSRRSGEFREIALGNGESAADPPYAVPLYRRGVAGTAFSTSNRLTVFFVVSARRSRRTVTLDIFW